MKKALSLILALVLCLSLCACGTDESDKEAPGKAAFTSSQSAFECVTRAYIATNEFSSAIYEAWFQGVNNKSNFDNEYEMYDFADEVDIELEHIKQAVANLMDKAQYENGDWELLPYGFNNSYFSAWVSVVAEAYKCSGKTAAIEANLNEAKDIMKKLSDTYSDYEHYPALKEYFTNTLAFYDFCRNPEGSFEQVKDTFNSYRNNAREYFFDLNYVFGDSIGGMDNYTVPEKEDINKS